MEENITQWLKFDKKQAKLRENQNILMRQSVPVTSRYAMIFGCQALLRILE